MAEMPTEFLDLDVPAGAKVTLMALWSHAGGKDEAPFVWPSTQRLVDLTGQTMRSTQRHLRTLEGLGVIESTDAQGHRGWVLRRERSDTSVAENDTSDATPVTHATPVSSGGDTSDAGGDSSVADKRQKVHRTKEEPPIEPTMNPGREPGEPSLPWKAHSERVAVALTMLSDRLLWNSPEPPKGRSALRYPGTKSSDLLGAMLRDPTKSPEDVVVEILGTIGKWARLADRGVVDPKWWGPNLFGRDVFGIVQSEVEEAEKPKPKPQRAQLPQEIPL